MSKKVSMLNIHFSDFFEVKAGIVEKYGAFNISLINDLPLFIDPFLLFNSKKSKYQILHKEIIDYLLFLKKISSEDLDDGSIRHYFKFPEVKQTWLGFSQNGNSGAGLGKKFAVGLSSSFKKYLANFGEEELIKSHLEKVCLFDTGIGKDNISDFTTNLIVGYLAEYTEKFAKKEIKSEFLRKFRVEKYKFNYDTYSWTSKIFTLPFFEDDYVLLVPEDILTKDNTWINNEDKINQFYTVLEALPNEEQRARVNQYFNSILKRDSKGNTSKKDEKQAKMSRPAFFKH